MSLLQKPLSKITLLFSVLVLVGQGCLGLGGGDAPGSGDPGGIWRTTDFGETFVQLRSLPQVDGVGSIGGVNVRFLEIDPNDTSVYYLGTVQNGLFYTVDNGATWQRPEEEIMRTGEILGLAVDPKDSCTLYVTKGRSLYKTTDCLRSFERIYTEGGTAQNLTRVAVDWFNPQIVWLGNTDGDVLKSVDGGRNWVASLRAASSIFHIEISNADSRIVLVGTSDRGTYRTQDTGASWDRLTLNSDFPGANTVYGFSQFYDGSVILMNNGYGILYSTDAGLTWGALTLVTSPSEVRIWDMAIDPRNRQRMYYTTYGKLFISENGGDTWRNVPLPSGRAPIVLQPHPDTPEVLLFGFRTIPQ